MVKKIGILTSGGDAPGMNSAIRAVTRTALINGIEVVGIHDGYRGLLEEKFENYTRKSVSSIMSKGGTILGSARLKEFKNEDVQKQAVEILKKHNIDALVVIGGDGSYRGANALTQLGVNCIGLPGTIDNDIQGTDFTIGYDTALNTIVECVDKLRDTSSSHHRASVVEVMGNHCGDLAINAGIACGAEIIVTPETGYDEEKIMNRLNELDGQQKDHAIIIVSEKLTDVNELADKITKNTTFGGRSTILGHIQRGGSPSPNDRVLASRMGVKAVELLIEGKGGQCVVLKDNMISNIGIDEALALPRPNRKDVIKIFEDLV